jgi:hypothetical protein
MREIKGPPTAEEAEQERLSKLPTPPAGGQSQSQAQG